MANIDPVSKESPKTFFSLPQEIRDEIYRCYCNETSCTAGPLHDYVEIPNPAPLAVNKQLRSELSPIFFESLQRIILRGRVYFKLKGSTTPGQARHAGWNVWSWGGRLRVYTWVRDDNWDDEFIAWWVPALSLEQNSSTLSTRSQGWPAVLEYSKALERLMGVTCKWFENQRVQNRLNGIRQKVDRVIERVYREEEEHKAKVEKMGQSIGPFGMTRSEAEEVASRAARGNFYI